MDNSLNTSEVNDSYSAISTLVRALKTTIQLNEIVKSKLLDERNFFSDQQMRVIYENLNLLDDNTLILNQAIQAIRSLLSEIKNLKEIKALENSHYQEFSGNRINKNIIYNSNYLDTDFVNRYNFNNNSNNFSKSEEEIKMLESSLKTNVSNNILNKMNFEKGKNENAMKLNFDYNYDDEKNENVKRNNELINHYQYEYNNDENFKTYKRISSYKNENLNHNEILNKQNEEIGEEERKSFNEKYNLEKNYTGERKSLRQIIQSSKNKSERISRNEINRKEDDISFNSNSVDPNKSVISIEQENVSIDMIKISNEIMKNIQVTEKYSDYFADKYSDNSYKNFLSNLIGYKYNQTTLQNILKDIRIKIRIEGMNLPYNITHQNIHKPIEKEENLNNSNINVNNSLNSNLMIPDSNPGYYLSGPNNSRGILKNMEKNSFKDNNKNDYKSANIKNIKNCQEKRKESSNRNNSFLSKRNSSFEVDKKQNDNPITYQNPNFEKLLRNYTSGLNKKKPFNRFTRLHGNYFEKDILTKNGSPIPSQKNIKGAAYENISPRIQRK